MCPSLLGLDQSTFLKTSHLNSTVGFVSNKALINRRKFETANEMNIFCGLSCLYLLSRESEKALKEICRVHV